MKMFGSILSDFLKEYSEELTDAVPLEKDPQFYLTTHWSKIAKLFADKMLTQAISNSIFVSLEKETLVLSTENAHTRFILNMNSATIIAEVNSIIQTQCEQAVQSIKKLKVILPTF